MYLTYVSKCSASVSSNDLMLECPFCMKHDSNLFVHKIYTCLKIYIKKYLEKIKYTNTLGIFYEESMRE